MMSFRKIAFGAAVALGLAGSGSMAHAWGSGCNGPMCNQPKYPSLGMYLFGGHANKQPLPTFQAAPWYLYWPYDAHFLTPAPVNAPFYGPAGAGNFPVNPYFPSPAYAPYGPMPGGPPPLGYGQPPAGYAPPPPAGYAQPPGGYGPPPGGYGPRPGYGAPTPPVAPAGYPR